MLNDASCHISLIFDTFKKQYINAMHNYITYFVQYPHTEVKAYYKYVPS